VKPVYLDEGVVWWLEAESDEEREFIRSCPSEWTLERVRQEWETVDRGD